MARLLPNVALGILREVNDWELVEDNSDLTVLVGQDRQGRTVTFTKNGHFDVCVANFSSGYRHNTYWSRRHNQYKKRGPDRSILFPKPHTHYAQVEEIFNFAYGYIKDN